MRPRKGGLFFKALLALVVVSILPALLIGWHVLRVDSHILTDEMLDKQRTVANRMALAIVEEVNREIQFLSVFTSLHSDFESHPDFDQEDFDYLRKQNPRIDYVALVNEKGKILFGSGRKTVSTDEEIPNWNKIFSSCFEQQQPYIGSGYTTEGNLSVQLGFPVVQSDGRKTVEAVLVAKTNLKGLESILLPYQNPRVSSFLLSEDGKIIAYAGVQKKVSAHLTAELQDTAYTMARYMQDSFSKQIKFPDGFQRLVSKAEVPLLGWTLFVEQPANIVSKQLWESTFHSLRDVFFIFLVLALFIVAVTYLVLIPIIRPVKKLQQAAVRLEEEDDYIPCASDLIIPDNEIGELCHVFLHMAETLRERKQALLAAQKRLLASNEELEQRVRLRNEELKNATEELVKAERLVAIGQMASIISHEIRNPLAVISNAAKLIKTIRPPTEPKLIKQFAIIDQEINQANGIISEVLGYARSRDMILSVIDLNSYLHDIAVSFPIAVHIRLTEELDPESVRLKIDGEEIKQALRNLISNACESMPQGGTLTVGTRIGKKVACVFVADEGPGISAELKEKMFSPFFTTKARGTGLGLAVVQKAVNRHKGKLFVHNRPDKGAVFEIYLKIYEKNGDTRYG